MVRLIVGEGDAVMSTMKYASLDLGTIEAVFNKLGGMDGAQRFLRGEIAVSEPARHWREEDGVIYFEVTSNGTPVPSGLNVWRRRASGSPSGPRMSCCPKISSLPRA